MNLLKLQCKSCNAPLNYVSGSTHLICDHCGMSYIVVDQQSERNSIIPNGTGSKDEGLATRITFVEVGVNSIHIEEPEKYTEQHCVRGFNEKTKKEYVSISNMDGFKAGIDRATWCFSVLSYITGQIYNLDLGRLSLHWKYYLCKKYDTYNWEYQKNSYGNKTQSYLEYEQNREELEQNLEGMFPSEFEIDTPPDYEDLHEGIMEHEYEMEEYLKEKGVNQVSVQSVRLPLQFSAFHIGPSITRSILNMFTTDSGEYECIEGKYGLWVFDDTLLTISVTPDNCGSYVDVDSLSSRIEKIKQHKIVEDISGKLNSIVSNDGGKDSIYIETDTFSVSCGNERFSFDKYNMHHIEDHETKMLLLSVILSEGLKGIDNNRWNIVSFKEKHDFDHKDQIDFILELHPRIERHVERVIEPWE